MTGNEHSCSQLWEPASARCSTFSSVCFTNSALTAISVAESKEEVKVPSELMACSDPMQVTPVLCAGMALASRCGVSNEAQEEGCSTSWGKAWAFECTYFWFKRIVFFRFLRGRILASGSSTWSFDFDKHRKPACLSPYNGRVYLISLLR